MKKSFFLFFLLMIICIDASSNSFTVAGNKRHFRRYTAGVGGFYGFPSEAGATFRVSQFNYESFDILGTSPIVTWGPSLSGALSYDHRKNSPYARIGVGYEHSILMILSGVKMDALYVTDFNRGTVALAPSAGIHFLWYELYYAAEVPLFNTRSFDIEHRITLTWSMIELNRTILKVSKENGKKTVSKPGKD